MSLYLSTWGSGYVRLSFKEHLGQITKKVNKRLGMLSRMRKNVTRDTVLMLYKSLVLPHLEFCDSMEHLCR